MIRTSGALALSAALGCAATAAAEPDRSRDWIPIWEDEFNGPADSPPNPENWKHDLGTDWGNACLEYDTDRLENARLNGEGQLVITARREEFEGQPFTSARISTAGSFDRRYGRIEARIRLPHGRGIGPAFWMLGSSFEEVGWPACGEIDVMEFRGHEPTILHGSCHGPGYSAAEALTTAYEHSEPLHEEFHVFAVEWEPERIRWRLDDHVYAEVTPADLPESAPWVFDRPFFLILNCAVGGHFAGPPADDTPFPQEMLVDWVRVYRRAG